MNTRNTSENLFKGAIIGGMINAIINGIKYWFEVKEMTDVKLTDNLISSTEHTVFASAVPLATSLAFFLTCISYFTTKLPGKMPFFPKVLFLAFKNAIFVFGFITVFAILFQRYAGSVSVSPLTATFITAIISGLIAGTVNYLTKKEILP